MFYNVIETHLEGALSKFHFVSFNGVSHSQQEMLEEAARESDIPISTMEAAWKAVTRVVRRYVRNGDGMHNDLFSGSGSITGPADSADANFVRGINETHYNLVLGPALAQEQGAIVPVKSPSSQHGPVITSVIDVNSGLINTVASPSYTMRVTGNRLKIVGEPPNVAIEFVTSAGAVYAVSLSTLVINRPSELVFTVPSLPTAVPFRFRVTTCFGNGTTLLKTPHTTTFEPLLRTYVHSQDGEADGKEGQRQDSPPTYREGPPPSED
jgi:hypothetical protein